MQPLLEYIRMVLEEGRFNFEHFNSIRNFKKRDEYLQSTKLKRLGCGSSRCAYVLSSKWVLKAGINVKGIGQNQAEVDIFTNPSTAPIISKIQDFAPDFSWLVSELVRPLHGQAEFEKLTNVSWYDAMAIVNGLDGARPGGRRHRGRAGHGRPQRRRSAPGPAGTRRGRQAGLSWSDDGADDYKTKTTQQDSDEMGIQIDEPASNIDDVPKQYKGKSQIFLQALNAFMKSSKLMPADIDNIGHWGKTADERVVILDYGFTDQVAQRFYAPGRY